MYNLLEHSHNLSIKSKSLWNYCRDEISDVDIDDYVLDVKSFDYKTKIVGETPERPAQPRNSGDTDQPPQPQVPSLNVEVTIPLKYLSNFWKSLDYL